MNSFSAKLCRQARHTCWAAATLHQICKPLEKALQSISTSEELHPSGVVSVTIEKILRRHASNRLQMCKVSVNSMVIKMRSDQQLGRLKLEAGSCSICQDTWQGQNIQKWRQTTLELSHGVAYLRVIEQLYSSKAVMWVGILLLGLLLHCCHHALQLGLLLLLAGLGALQPNEPGASDDVVTLIRWCCTLTIVVTVSQCCCTLKKHLPGVRPESVQGRLS